MNVRRTIAKLVRSYKSTTIRCKLEIPEFLSNEKSFCVNSEKYFMLSNNFKIIPLIFQNDILDQEVETIEKQKVYVGYSYFYSFDLYLSKDYIKSKKDYLLENYPYTRKSRFEEVCEIISKELGDDKATETLESLTQVYEDKDTDDISFFNHCSLMIKYLPYVKTYYNA